MIQIRFQDKVGIEQEYFSWFHTSKAIETIFFQYFGTFYVQDCILPFFWPDPKFRILYQYS